jgi:hypothetical protein
VEFVPTSRYADVKVAMRVERAEWAYNLLRPGWENIASIGEALVFYETSGPRGLVAYLLTEKESIIHRHDPVVIKYKDYSHVPGGSSYTHLVSY